MRAIRGKRRDTAEKPIVDALRSVGAFVQYLHGDGAPDLLCCYRGVWMPFEVKTGKGKRTAAQEQTQYPICRTPDEALQQIGAVWRHRDDR